MQQLKKIIILFFFLDCEDVPYFLDEKGLKCSSWAGYDCRSAQELYGYSEKGEKEIIEKCCFSCSDMISRITPGTPNTCKQIHRFFLLL